MRARVRRCVIRRLKAVKRAFYEYVGYVVGRSVGFTSWETPSKRLFIEKFSPEPCIRVYATGHNTFPRLYLIAAKSGRVKITLFVRPRFIDLAFRHSSVNLVRVSPKL